jgi:class 3 adenylate cyclase
MPRAVRRALGVGLAAVWLLGFGLMLRVLATDHVGAWPDVLVAAPESSHDYPTVVGFQAWASPRSGLARGDRLVRVGGTDLRGVGPIGFAVAARHEAGPGLAVPVAALREGVARQVELRLRPHPVGALLPVIAAAYALLALWIWRAASSREAKAAAHFLLATSFLFLMFHGSASRLQVQAWLVVNSLAFVVVGPLALRWVFLSPSERLADRPVPRWIWLFAALGVSFPSWLVGWPLPASLGGPLHNALAATLVVVAFAVFVRNHRRASPVARRRQRWVLLGAGVAFGVLLIETLAGVVLAGTPAGTWVDRVQLSWIAMLLPPVFLFVAITRYDVYDVDRWISRTLSYGVVIAALVLALGVGLPFLAELLARSAGMQERSAQIVVATALVALALPGERAVRDRVERLLFSGHYALENGVQALLGEISASVAQDELFQKIGARVDTLFRPVHLALHAWTGTALQVVFTRGSRAPPAFEPDSPLIASLARRHVPMRAQDSGTRPFDRAVLETLDAELAVPIRGTERLAALLSLGPKQSGDVYTSTDASLLSAIAQAVSGALARSDATANREQAERMRRYVPGPVAERIAAGREMEAGAQQVTVLFVDIRGYSTAAESRSPEEIFSAINLYTEVVSGIVRQKGGTVVEFNGDGMMTVFGAPDALPNKERAAVEAAREIVEAVVRMTIGAEAATPLSVGIGVASGDAYVGSVRSADRLLWTALGNATNRASRFQALTRELGAAIVIDALTRSGAGWVTADFEQRADVAIRGREQHEELFVLPLTRA